MRRRLKDKTFYLPTLQKYVREELLVEQIKNFLQKVSLSSQDTEKVLRELENNE